MEKITIELNQPPNKETLVILRDWLDAFAGLQDTHPYLAKAYANIADALHYTLEVKERM